MTFARTICLSLLLVLLGAGLSAEPAFAEDAATAQARQLFEDAQKQFDLGNWDAAVAGFSKAYELRPDPIFLYNMAQAYRRAGNAKRAVDLYKNYLIKNPKSPQRAEVEEKIKGLQRQIDAEEKEAKRAAAASAAPVTVPTTGSGPALPEVGAAAQPAPDTAPADPGAAEGKQPVAQAGDPLAPPPQAPPTEAWVARPADQAGAPSEPKSGSRGLRIAGIITGATGGVALLAGLLYSARVKQLSNSVTNAPTYNDADAQEGKRDQKSQWTCYGAGVVLVAAGAYLYWRGRPSKQHEVSVALGPWLGESGGGLLAAGSFR